MKFASAQVCINPLQLVEQAGHIQQNYKLIETHDDLYARIFVLEDQFIFMHVSVDNLGLPLSFQQEMEETLQPHFDKPLHLVISCTHSHHAGNPKDDVYRQQIFNQIYDVAKSIDFKEYQKIEVTFRNEIFDEVGKSRISNHTAKVNLNLFEFIGDGTTLATIINYNTHPTILFATTPFFSAEYPGYVIKSLSEKYPLQFFTFMQGADGDISTRFTRISQDYTGVEDLGTKLVNEVIKMKNTPTEKRVCLMSFNTQTLPIQHEFNPIDLKNIPDNLSARELETIGYGKIVREQLSLNQSELVKEIIISCLDFGGVKIIFAPNEMFSSYLDEINITHTCLTCYSNGYSPYVTAPGSTLLTYETFTDTMTLDTKKSIVKLLNHWGK